MARLVLASRNFAFLTQSALVLGGDLAAAEGYVYSDPDAAMGKARRFSETLAKMLLQDAGLSISGTQAQRTQALFAAGLIDVRLRDLFDQIRHAGNQAVHESSGDVDKALKVVEACFELSTWWYHRKTGTTVNRVFSAPVRVPTAEESLQVQLQGLEAQLTQMQVTLEAGFADTEARTSPSRITIRASIPDQYEWRGGSEVTCGSTTYLVHDPVERVSASDGSWTMLQADAHALDSTARPVRLGAIRMERDGRLAEEMLLGLRAQAEFLKARRHYRGLPAVVSFQHVGKLHTLVTTAPQAVSWQKMFGNGSEPLDPLVLQPALGLVATVADCLAELHRAGQAHRAITGTSVLVQTQPRVGRLRDLGWAWWPMQGTGSDYTAPEERTLARGRSGPPTDVFQLAALLQHTCTGVHPSAGRVVPLQVFFPGVPTTFDELLERSLDPDPLRRPSMVALAAGVRQVYGQLHSEAAACPSAE